MVHDILAGFGVLVSIFAIMNISIRNFFEQQTFDTIEYSQSRRLQAANQLSDNDLEETLNSIDVSENPSAQEYERSVNHFMMTEKRFLLQGPQGKKPFPFANKLKQALIAQEEQTKRYIFKTDQLIYAVVTKVELRGLDAFIISYMHETYTKGLIGEMNKNIITVLLISLFLSSIIARFIARRITKPLKALETQFTHIAHKEWQEDLVINRGDEIGRLAISVNLMQQTLKEKDLEEKHFIQTVSHDLKTPIMVIRSYAQAVLDGIIPTDDIQNSIQLIDNEAYKMDDKIKDMIYLYTLRNQPVAYEDYKQLNSKTYLENLIKRFQYTTDKITLSSDIEAFELSVNEKTFTVAIENILENGLRFAESIMKLSCQREGNDICIRIYNDGSQLENPERIFKRYETENRGNTGLGMAITKEIIVNHQGTILAENEENGVVFIIRLPKLV